MVADPLLFQSLLSPFATKLAAVAKRERAMFGRFKETDPPLAERIRQYWTALGLPFPGVGRAWSAVFVSWCVKTAGATKAEFRFSAQHSVFVHRAIQNAAAQSGAFRAYPITHYGPQVGDIIQNNRGGQAYTYGFAAKNLYYSSHSAIVVGQGEDAGGPYVVTAGGNESNSVGLRRHRLDASGLLKQREKNPYICVIQTLK